MKHKVFCTGGAGFIGSHICKSISSYSYDQKNYQHLWSYAQLIREIKRSKCNIISHHAAILEILSSEDNPEVDLKENVLNTLIVLRATKECGIKRFIFASSACVYGQTIETWAGVDWTTLIPNWYYGLSKLTAEKYIQMFCEKNDIKYTILRYAIVYGENEWFGRVLTYFIKRALENKPLIVFDPDVVRDFIYVGDVVRFHNYCIKKNLEGIYNVGTGVPTTILELAQIVKKVAKSKSMIVIRNLQKIEGRKRLPYELRRICLEPEMGIKYMPLEEGIQREIMWYKKNKEAWDVEPKV